MNKVNWRYLELDGHPLPNRIVLAQDCKNKTAVVIMSKIKNIAMLFSALVVKNLCKKKCGDGCIWRK